MDESNDGGKRLGARGDYEDAGSGSDDGDAVDGREKKSSKRGDRGSRGAGGGSRSGRGHSGSFSGRGPGQLAPHGALGPVGSFSSFGNLQTEGLPWPVLLWFCFWLRSFALNIAVLYPWFSLLYHVA